MSCKMKENLSGKQQNLCCLEELRCIDKRCYVHHSICKFTGPEIKVVEKKQCGMSDVLDLNTRKLLGKRKKCCSWKEECNGSECVKSDIKCEMVGDLVVSKVTVTCDWVDYKQGKKKRCCKSENECNGDKCEVVKKKLSAYGLLCLG